MPEHIHIVRRRMFLFTVVFSVLIFFAFALAGYGLWQIHEDNVHRFNQSEHDRVVLCKLQNDSNDALRHVLSLAERSTNLKALTPSERRRHREFYRKAFALIKPINCQKEHLTVP